MLGAALDPLKEDAPQNAKCLIRFHRKAGFATRMLAKGPGAVYHMRPLTRMIRAPSLWSVVQ